MNTPIAANGNIFLVVGYDGSPPSSRALDAAARLLQGRSGRIDVVYVAHLPAVDMLSAGAVAEMEVSFDEIERDLRAAASKQLDGREERWRFERGQGIITDQLLAAATNLRDEHPDDNVVDRRRQLLAGRAPAGRLGGGQPGPPLPRARGDRALEGRPGRRRG